MQTNYADQSKVIVYDAGSLTNKLKVVRHDAYIRAMQGLIDTYDKLIAQKDEEITNLKKERPPLPCRQCCREMMGR